MKLIILILLTLISSCQQNNYTVTKKEKLVNEVTKKVAIQLKKENELYPCGSGGRTMNGIEMLAICFDYYKPLSIDEGRNLLIYVTNLFINEINAENRIHPYLNNYPFKPANVKIIIYLRNQDGSSVQLGNLRVISIAEGKLIYDVGDPGTNLLKTIYKESYEEALEKISVLEKK